jgi:glycyl-tRNA synthetase beta chain
MPDLLLELTSEEIPARMQARAEQDLLTLVGDGLKEAGLTFGETETFSGPRRLALIARDLPGASAAVIEERKGPRVGAPEKAIAGFLKSAGLQSLDRCDVVRDGKGDFYVARVEKPGRAASAIVAEVVSGVVRSFPWPKSMRWGEGRLRWVRPLHGIVCLLDGEAVEFSVDGVPSGRKTVGHRFLCGRKTSVPGDITIPDADHYPDVLMHAKIVAQRNERLRIIQNGAQNAAKGLGLVLVEDHGLMNENAGLAEWPVVLTGSFDERFLDVPAEILTTAMRTHQKYFALRDPASGRLANKFILVANLEAPDGGKAIVAGNERVLRARLSDAEFFWKQDVTAPLANLVPALAQVTFHEKLGTQLERVERLTQLTRLIAPMVGADPEKAAHAAPLAKADLLTGTVGEFPELEGVIGRYIAIAQGEPEDVADAIALHYKPKGPSDEVPKAPVSVALALADKFDLLAGFRLIGEKPTGSKDPFALRRAALGIIRIVTENGLRLDARAVADAACQGIMAQRGNTLSEETASGMVADLLAFMADRLKVYLRDQGIRHDAVDAVYALPDQTDFGVLVARVRALHGFLATEDGAALLTLVRRALNILRIEEKKDGHAYTGKPAAKALKNKAEKALHTAIKAVAKEVDGAVKTERFDNAMSAMAKLRSPVDAFFENVTVNAEDRDVRRNRLELLASIRVLTANIADFTLIEG